MDIIIDFLNKGFWSYEFLGNTVGDYVIALGVFIGVTIILKIFQLVVLTKLKELAKRTDTDVDDEIVKIAESLKPIFYIFVALYFGLKALTLASILSQAINVAIIAVLVYQVSKSLNVFIDYILDKAREREAQGSTKTAIQLIGKIVKATIWVIAVLLALSNFGVNVTSLIAGLGIGGIAVAMAAQNILGDLFNSFVIYFDKPFVVGDFIVVGDKRGTVEKIGIKTTRIRSLSGEEIVFSNTDLTSAKIHNYKKMEKRRASFKFGVTYDTPPEKLNKIPKIVEEVVGSINDVEFDRGFFEKFGDSAIVFEVVYFVDKSDYNLYAERNQEIGFKLKKELNDEGMEMAFPTQTIYLKKD
ncbi:MAG TPA: mechanosensitive ion channel family protein [Candidatus Paceibacterota bacterium]|nr:mechanosensitive ion channel family protein [Candidatus Paceibacterota bacterium]